MIKVLYFARLREDLGCSAEEVSSPAGVANIGALRAALAARGGAWAQAFAAGNPVRAAVNQDLANDDTPIAEGDEVAFFPPVTGG